jgi:hypothetical protein
MNRANLEKLAAYLESLPADYEHFSMESYLRNADDYFYWTSMADTLQDCGTVACAIGHGPAAGITPLPGENWDLYTDRVFELEAYQWSWCFSSSWHQVDNTPQGAAKRIRYMLDHGVPENVDRQKAGRDPYLFAKGVAA